jgi:hypothetical protein
MPHMHSDGGGGGDDDDGGTPEVRRVVSKSGNLSSPFLEPEQGGAAAAGALGAAATTAETVGPAAGVTTVAQVPGAPVFKAAGSNTCECSAVSGCFSREVAAAGSSCLQVAGP